MKVVSFVILLLQVHNDCGEIYTSIAQMEELIETESVMINSIERYIYFTEQKMRKLKTYLNEYITEYNTAVADIEQYLSNPINAYLLIKRLTSNWNDVERLMCIDNDTINIIEAYRSNYTLKIPTPEDLNGAATALIRLQETYNLKASSLARGEVNGIQFNTFLKAEDCYELGRQSFFNQDYNHTILWMKEALDLFDRKTDDTAFVINVLDFLSYSTFMVIGVKDALNITMKILELKPDHPRAIESKEYYEKYIENIGELPYVKINASSKDERYKKDRSRYERTCRGDVVIEEEVRSKLRCMYIHNDVPFLKLARVKAEEAHLKPEVMIYHDVIYDSEIETVKRLAHPRLERASVRNFWEGEPMIVPFRIGKFAGLLDGEHKHVSAINRRIEDLTGLTAKTGEPLQVVNYGIGGHYEPHFDFTQRPGHTEFYANYRDRIATFLFYMSDVLQGGATAFPSINLPVWPRKGSAVLWFNLHRSGQPDLRTTHAACPVLSGSKWIVNKWLHEAGQEFRRKCALYDDTIRFLPPDLLTKN